MLKYTIGGGWEKDILVTDKSFIVLAGGKGTRLGCYKALETINNESLIQRAVSSLSFFNSDIIVVTGKGQHLPQFTSYPRLRIVTDAYDAKGPLVGIYTGLLASASSYNFVVACDMPLLNRALIGYMLELSVGFDVVIPRVGSLVEPLHAVYSKGCISAIEQLLKGGNHKIDRLLDLVKVRYVEAGEIDRFDPEHFSFFNINTKADFEVARGLVKKVPQSDPLSRLGDNNWS